MNDDDTIEAELHGETEALEREIKELRQAAPIATGETIAWFGSRGRGRWMRLSWTDERGPLGGTTGLVVGIWSEDAFGAKAPVRHGAFTLRIQEIPLLARAILLALARGRKAAKQRQQQQAEYAERRSGGSR